MMLHIDIKYQNTEAGELKVTDESVESESGGSGSISNHPCSIGGENSRVSSIAGEMC